MLSVWFNVSLTFLTAAAPTSGLVGRCDAPEAVGDLLPGATKTSAYVIAKVERVEDARGNLVGWRYDSREGPAFIQPSSGLSIADASVLRVSVPRAGIGQIYLRNTLPLGLKLIQCR